MVCDMVKYEIAATGPMGHQVTAISPEWQSVVVGDFSSLQAAEDFAARMREIDANVHSIANSDLTPSASRP
jgi:hypothetical protein